MGGKRSFTGGPAVPYHPRARHIEAAKHLRLTVTRYINDRASFGEVEEAFAMLREEADPTGETPRGEGEG